MADAMAIAHNADGSMLAAETALSFSKEEKQFLELFMALMRKAYQNQMADLKEWTVTISAFGRETIIRFLNYCLRLVRENFIMNLNVPQLNYLNSAEAAFSSKFSRFINERNVERISQEFDSAITDIAGNANPKLVLFDLAVRMCIYLKAWLHYRRYPTTNDSVSSTYRRHIFRPPCRLDGRLLLRISQ